MRFSIYFLLLLLIISTKASAQQNKLKAGNYSAYLRLNQTTKLPIHFSIEKKGKQTLAIVQNAEERIELTVSKTIGDTLVLPFLNFDSELRVVLKKGNKLEGYWINFNRPSNNKIPFFAEINLKTTKNNPAMGNISGKWETYFSATSNEKEPAVGLFKQENNRITGTVLTETGDYRYLEGTMENNTFYLSAFDGTHAFLLQGSVSNNELTGTFFSGKLYQTPFKAIKNDGFNLRNPDSLTVKTTNQQLSFQLKDLLGNDYLFPNSSTKGKVVIVQIMGTWCPNCMDETRYYKELYDKYHDKGLEIISIGYENAPDFTQQAAKIQRLKERLDLKFTFLVGGNASKSLASKQFNVLNEIISFPTSIYIGRDGEIKRIHTGFTGPGTGNYYTEFVTETNAFVEELMNQ